MGSLMLNFAITNFAIMNFAIMDFATMDFAIIDFVIIDFAIMDFVILYKYPPAIFSSCNLHFNLQYPTENRALGYFNNL